SLFEAMLALEEAEDADPTERVKLLASAGRAIAETSRASQGQKKWAQEQRAKLDALEAEAGRGSKRLDADTLKAVREALYG
ncbi:MAG: phage protein Gp27 family protein, partial [Pseudomonadota bacterium]